jgi:glycosyltransferase involved in cell wall biosynthesis
VSFIQEKQQKSNPLVSIIVVTYNAIDTINSTIQNILNQTYKNKELIIIDGASNDGTIQIIENYSAHLSYFFSEKDNGIYDAMNKGIPQALGDWIIFMNSGDYFANSTVLEDVFEIKKIRDEVNVIYGNTVINKSDSIINPPKKINKNYFYFETICHQSLFCKRSAFNSLGTFNTDYKLLADREWLLRARLLKLGFQYIPVNICIWETSGFSSNNLNLYNLENVRLQQSYFNLFERGFILLNAHLRNFIIRLSKYLVK